MYNLTLIRQKRETQYKNPKIQFTDTKRTQKRKLTASTKKFNTPQLIENNATLTEKMKRLTESWTAVFIRGVIWRRGGGGWAAIGAKHGGDELASARDEAEEPPRAARGSRGRRRGRARVGGGPRRWSSTDAEDLPARPPLLRLATSSKERGHGGMRARGRTASGEERVGLLDWRREGGVAVEREGGEAVVWLPTEISSPGR